MGAAQGDGGSGRRRLNRTPGPQGQTAFTVPRQRHRRGQRAHDEQAAAKADQDGADPAQQRQFQGAEKITAEKAANPARTPKAARR
jgi:hypothetical protein